jgi:hypothetical protein
VVAIGVVVRAVLRLAVVGVQVLRQSVVLLLR